MQGVLWGHVQGGASSAGADGHLQHGVCRQHSTVQYSTAQYSTVQYSMACAGNTSAEGNITKTRRGDVDPFEKNRDFDVVLACAREIGGAVNGTS